MILKGFSSTKRSIGSQGGSTLVEVLEVCDNVGRAGFGIIIRFRLIQPLHDSVEENLVAVATSVPGCLLPHRHSGHYNSGQLHLGSGNAGGSNLGKVGPYKALEIRSGMECHGPKHEKVSTYAL